MPRLRPELLAASASCAILAGVACALWLGRSPSPDAVATSVPAADDPPRDYDPLATALASIGATRNRDAAVPPQCYTKTAGSSNPCFTCHTRAHGKNEMDDWRLQEEYSFSEPALVNNWRGLFRDRRSAIAKITDRAILRYIREDNYTPLRRALERRKPYAGWVPDLNLTLGFDEQGFAHDGSGWRALRYKPFPGTFWPTNGSTDDVFIRLPARFRSDKAGKPSRDVYRANLAILEASITKGEPAEGLDRAIEPTDERLISFDLDADGKIGTAKHARALPPSYAGAAHGVEVVQGAYPEGTEFMHTVRYIDPDSPSLLSARLKELRYSRKVMLLDGWATSRAYEREKDEKDEGTIPVYPGSPEVGYRNAFGWQLQGFIEDREGRLRAQTEEEHRYCMGCHSTLGVTIDQTFAFGRKLPGAAGFLPQDLRGIPDVPQLGHRDPETLEYLRRVSGGDEFRANAEMLARFFPRGALDEREVRRAAPGGDRDLTHLVAPSRERALELDKAYRALVEAQEFALGRDAVVGPIANVHERITDRSTGLEQTDRVYTDGRLLLDWSAGIRTASR
jgi:hypothetical protein